MCIRDSPYRRTPPIYPHRSTPPMCQRFVSTPVEARLLSIPVIARLLCIHVVARLLSIAVEALLNQTTPPRQRYPMYLRAVCVLGDSSHWKYSVACRTVYQSWLGLLHFILKIHCETSSSKAAPKRYAPTRPYRLSSLLTAKSRHAANQCARKKRREFQRHCVVC